VREQAVGDAEGFMECGILNFGRRDDGLGKE
jgi:hypothetical protein